MKRIPSTALLFFASIAQLHAQTKLPDELRTSFGQFGPTETSFIYTYEFNLEPVKGRVTLFNGNDTRNGLVNNVSIEWNAVSQAEGNHVTDQMIPTGFQPTAATRSNGQCDTLYVAGWADLTGEVIVEKWDFKPKAYPITTITFPAPSVVRTEILRCDTIQPISSITRNPNSNELWMLEWELTTPKKLLALDLGLTTPDCSSLKVLYDAGNPDDLAAYPQMIGLRSIYSGTHPSAGWIVYFEERPRWRSRRTYATPYNILVGFDGNLDGALDSHFFNDPFCPLFNVSVSRMDQC